MINWLKNYKYIEFKKYEGRIVVRFFPFHIIIGHAHEMHDDYAELTASLSFDVEGLSVSGFEVVLFTPWAGIHFVIGFDN